MIGIPIESDTLVLTRGRDFPWSFENIDPATGLPVDYPEGELFFELNTGGQHNAVQVITTLRANGGSYTLDLGGTETGSLTFDDESTDVQAELEAIAGAGNVSVTGRYYPHWLLTVTLTGAAAPTLPRNVQSLVVAAVKETLDALEFLGAGKYDLEADYTPPTWTFEVIDRIGMPEKDWLTYLVDVINTSVETAIRAIGGVLNSSTVTVSQFYTPKRVFTAEFINDWANKPVPEIVPTSSLTGSNPEVLVDVQAPGKARLTIWPFTIDGSMATIKVESEEVDKVPARTPWQLVFLPDGEDAGGEAIDLGRVAVQGE